MIEIIGEAGKDESNGARRVAYKCSCGYTGTTRAVRALKMKWCAACNRKYSRLQSNEYSIDGDVAYIDVSTEKFPGSVAQIDSKDIPLVIDGKGRWFAANFSTDVVYAVRNQRGEKMHRHILGVSADTVIDHDDGNGLNNRRANLNAGKQKDNVKNRTLDRRNISGFSGVVPSPTRGKWVAQGSSDGEKFHLGTFESLHAAVAERKRFEATHGFNKNHGRARS